MQENYLGLKIEDGLPERYARELGIK